MSSSSKSVGIDHKAGLLFVPDPPNARPSDLFDFASNRVDYEASPRFRSKNGGESSLIFISSLIRETCRDPGHAFYACVWGPSYDSHHDGKLAIFKLEDGPQTMERAQIRAAIRTLKSLDEFYDHNVPSDIVLAYSGSSYLDQLAHTNDVEQVAGKGDNKDLEWRLAYLLLKEKCRGVNVQLWKIEKADNLARYCL